MNEEHLGPVNQEVDIANKSFILGMAGGNEHVAKILLNIFLKNVDIDPSNVLKEAGPLVIMIHMDILGLKIQALHESICGSCYIKTIGVLRAVQLGIISQSELVGALSSPIGAARLAEQVDDIMSQVYSKIPDFKRA